MLIVTSDGVDSELIMKNVKLLDDNKRKSAQNIAHMLGEMAMKSGSDELRDDITIAVLRVIRNN